MRGLSSTHLAAVHGARRSTRLSLPLQLELLQHHSSFAVAYTSGTTRPRLPHKQQVEKKEDLESKRTSGPGVDLPGTAVRNRLEASLLRGFFLLASNNPASAIRDSGETLSGVGFEPTRSPLYCRFWLWVDD